MLPVARAAAVVALSSALLLPGCADRRDPEEMKNSIVIGTRDDLRTFDPVYQKMMLEGAVMGLIQEPLTFYDKDQNLMKRTQHALIGEWCYSLSVTAAQAEHEMHLLLTPSVSVNQKKS